jgi:hypothetical protein
MSIRVVAQRAEGARGCEPLRQRAAHGGGDGVARDAAPIGRTLGDYLVDQATTLPIDDQIAIYATISAGGLLLS